MSALQLSLLLSVAVWATPAAAFTFAEGTSSTEPGAPSAIFYRAFTIYTGQEACASSRTPASLRVHLRMEEVGVGTRVHRDSPSELVVEAYDDAGTFLPAVPIVVEVLANTGVVASGGDRDYFEIIGPGEVEVVARWLCAEVRGSVRLGVSSQ